MINNMEAFPV